MISKCMQNPKINLIGAMGVSGMPFWLYRGLKPNRTKTYAKYVF